MAAISIWRLAIKGLAMEVPRRYTPSYKEFALRMHQSVQSGRHLEPAGGERPKLLLASTAPSACNMLDCMPAMAGPECLNSVI